jgi:DNA-binding FadR family transcriptional regulator
LSAPASIDAISLRARGNRLPAERELAQRFGVSRPTIREALAALELGGIVQSYKGKGTLIVATASQVASWGVEVLPPQIFEARVAIEPVLAALAAESAIRRTLRTSRGGGRPGGGVRAHRRL